jgi:D-alanyl-D-alanine carboxypeptidase
MTRSRPAAICAALAAFMAACTSGSSAREPARLGPATTDGPPGPTTTAIAPTTTGLLAASTTDAAAAARTHDSTFQDVLDAEVTSTPSIRGEVLLVRARGVDSAGASGYLDRERRVPLEPADGFRVASITKTFTAVLRLVEGGRISLDDPIADHLSPDSTAELVGDHYDPASITVRQLLTHTSGIYDYASDAEYQTAVLADPHKRWTRDEQVRFAVGHGDPLSPPGIEWHYSDTGYVLLGEIIERITAQPLAAAYRSLLRFDRLGLDHTYLETLEPTPPGVDPPAHQYAGDIDFATADPSFDLYGGGGLVSTTADLATFYQALFAGDVFDDPSTLATMLREPDARGAQGTGMGIFSTTIAGKECWGHSGFWGSDVEYCPDAALTIVLSVNQALPGEFNRARFERRVANLALH